MTSIEDGHLPETVAVPQESSGIPVATGKAERFRLVGMILRGWRKILKARENRAAEVVAKIIEGNGGRLTDAVERKIENRLFGNDSFYKDL